MKKLIILLILLIVPTYINAHDIGITMTYKPTAGEFVQGINTWSYLSDYISVGIFAKFNLLDEMSYYKYRSEIHLILKDRVIFGTDTFGQEVFLTGNILSVELSLNRIIKLNYLFYYFWDKGEDSNPIYMMHNSPIHRCTVDINIPIANF